MHLVRMFSERRLGGLEVQGKNFAHVGAELTQANDVSAQVTQGKFANGLNPAPTTPDLWASRQCLASMDGIRTRPCLLGDLRRMATVSRPGICARLAQVAAKVNTSQGGDIYRINDLLGTVMELRKAAISKYASSSLPRKKVERHGPLGSEGLTCRYRRRKVLCGTTTLAGWSDACSGGRTEKGRCRLGYVIGFLLS